ncbi:glucan endo-1,3-beta-glucosidase 11 [Rhododendron vialii]|uniref:glucan endo-1,3-beta-glucosidase 11 n=1 Tax=Rhododendron vialii TaxID=182163 RepID=UPI00265D7D2C|nr:glucan endo-1,3-beta-glucosidase 11 [Rhododendron vialii]
MPLSLTTALLLLSLLTTPTTSLPSTVGFTFNPTPTTPSPSHVASSLHSLRISSVRLPNPNPDSIRAFSYSNISLLLSLPNSLVPFLAHNRSNAHLFLYTHVVPFYPRARITVISVGSDPLLHSDDLSDLILPAIQNVHLALRRLGINDIAVSTTFSFLKVVTTAFPPSSAEFQPPVADVLVKPLLDFLDQTNSSFLVNLRPYDVYKAKHEIPIGFALFRETPFNFRDDAVTGVRYRNLFDAMVDAVVSAMAVAGHENIPVVVTETGWPSGQVPGVNGDPDATELFAGMYVNGLIEHLKSGLGTPLRKEGVAQAYVYELFDSDERQENGTGPVPYYGILYPNMTLKVNVDFSAASERVGGSGGGGILVRVAVRVLMAVVVVVLVLH